MNLPNKRSFLLVLTIVVLVAASLACNLPLRGRETPTPIPVNPSSVEELATEVAQAAAAAVSGDSIVLEFTEEQLTSAAALGYNRKTAPIQGAVSGDGMIRVTGTANQNGFGCH
jgi:hypothetical protein